MTSRYSGSTRAENRAGEHRDALLVDARLLQDVVLQPEPGTVVEGGHLRRAIGEMESILVGDPGFFIGAPIGVFTANQMAAIEVVGGVKLFADLGFDRNAAVKRPGIAVTMDRFGCLSIDIDRDEHRDLSRPRHHDGEMLIIETIALDAFDLQHIALAGAGRCRQRHGKLLEKIILISAAPRERFRPCHARPSPCFKRQLQGAFDPSGLRIERAGQANEIGQSGSDR